MRREVRVTPAAARDLIRLTAFLAERNPAAALRAGKKINEAVLSLDFLSERGRLGVIGRELDVRFGRYGYVIVYRVDAQSVVIARIFHTLEDRGAS